MVKIWKAIRDDFRAITGRFLKPPVLPSGMYTYRHQGPGGQRRMHLRVEPDGGGVLFVDVTEVVYLNATAAQMTKWALDRVPLSLAQSWLSAEFGWHARRQQLSDLTSIYEMVARFASPQKGCPTCQLTSLQRADLFSSAPAAPYKVDLAITYKCNNDCPHCYNEADRLTLESMELTDWKRVCDRLAAVGVPHFIFTGGEATLYPELPELIAYADSLGPICGLNSNGRRFSDRTYADRLKAAGLNHLQITLGSHLPEVHDRMMNATCYAQTLRGIRHAMEAGIHTITNTTLMRMNADQIEHTIEFLHDLGIETFAVNGMIYSGGGFNSGQSIPEEEMPAILIRIRDRANELGMRFLWYTPTQYCRLSPVELEIGAKRCNAGEYSVCIEPNGDVLPCQSYYVSAANILRDPWQSIWNSELFISFRDREDDPQKYGLPEKCWECPDLKLCGGGCRIEREAADGNRIAGTGCAGCAGGCGSDGHAVGFVGIENLQFPYAATADAPLASSRDFRRGTGVFQETPR